MFYTAPLKCRGKNIVNGGWVYGYAVPFENVSGWAITGEHYLLPSCDGIGTVEYCEVLNDTICMFTGVCDKDGNMIFEGDIVNVPMGYPEREMVGVIEYLNGAYSVTWFDKKYGRHFVGYLNNVRVVGNVFDNPGMMKEE